MSDSCDHMGCSLSGSSVHRIFQARILELVAISFSKTFINVSLSVIMWEQPSVTFYPGPVKNIAGEINIYFIKSLYYALVSIPYTAGIYLIVVYFSGICFLTTSKYPVLLATNSDSDRTLGFCEQTGWGHVIRMSFFLGMR